MSRRSAVCAGVFFAVAIVVTSSTPVMAQFAGPLFLLRCQRQLIASEPTHGGATYDSLLIQRLPLREVEDIVALFPGVVVDRRDGTTHIRGGFASDNEFAVDGVATTDGFSGIPRLVLGRDVIGSVSLNARDQYSFFVPELVQTETPGYAEQLHGSVEAVTDNFHGERDDYNIYSASLSGPLLRGEDKLTFAANVERRWYNAGRWNWFGSVRYGSTRTRAMIGTTGLDADWRSSPPEFLFNQEHAPRNTLKDYLVWGSAEFSGADGSRIAIYGDWHDTEGKRGDGVYFDNLWGYGRPGDGPAFNESTDLYRSWDDLHIDENGDRIVTPTYDSVLTVPFWYDQNLNGEVDEGEPFYLDGEPRDVSFTYNFTRIDSVVNDVEYTTRFADEGHVWDDYIAYEWSSIGGRIEAERDTRLMDLPLTLRAEADVRRHTVRFYENYFPARIYQGAQGGFFDIDSYGYDVLGNPSDEDGLNGAKHPVDLGGFVGATLRFEDLTLSGGVRADHFDYDAMAVRDPENPLDPDGYADPEVTPDPTVEQLLESQRLTDSDLKEADNYTRYSPRVRADLRVSGKTAAHLLIRRDHRRPLLSDLYLNFDYLEYKVKTGGYSVIFGNSGLEPMATTLYEAGIAHRPSPELSVSVVGFYKSLDHLVTVVNQPAQPTQYVTLNSGSLADSRGIEFRVSRHPATGRRGYVLDLNYALQRVVGTYTWAQRRNVAWTVSEPPALDDVPLPHDRRHTFVGIAGYSTGRGQAANSVLNNIDAFALFRVEGGLPYTKSQPFNEVTLGNANPLPTGKVNASRMPALYRLDVQISKTISLRRSQLQVFLWVINVFDRDNPIDVYSSSGLPDETGWLETPAGESFIAINSGVTDDSGLNGEQKYRLRENDPNHFDLPRQIRAGVRVSF